jgi:hypothetical protein
MRRLYNKVGHPKLPDNPTLSEVAQYLREDAIWEQLQPSGREMDAREWAATCLNSAADTIFAKVKEGK